MCTYKTNVKSRAASHVRTINYQDKKLRLGHTKVVNDYLCRGFGSGGNKRGSWRFRDGEKGMKFILERGDSKR